MRKRISSVVAVGVLFVALGAVDVYQGVAPYLRSVPPRRLAGDDILVLVIGVAAVVGGIAAIRGRRWARWLLAAWMALHVAISAGQPAQLAAHLMIFGFIAFLLFRSPGSRRAAPPARRRN